MVPIPELRVGREVSIECVEVLIATTSLNCFYFYILSEIDILSDKISPAGRAEFASFEQTGKDCPPK
jgi:hypothetical protein